MKKQSIIMSVLAIAIALSFLGTLAYFTAEEDATNKITMGNVAITLSDKTQSGEVYIPFPEEGLAAMPGDEISKSVHVKNSGDNEIWVRVRLTPSLTPAIEGYASLITWDANTINFSQSGDWYYYNGKVTPDGITTNLIEKVMFDAAMGNDYQDAVFALKVEAQAVQADNNGTTAPNATGWPTS